VEILHLRFIEWTDEGNPKSKGSRRWRKP